MSKLNVKKAKVVMLPTEKEQTPNNWLLLSPKDILHIPLAGGEYRRLIQIGWKIINLYIINDEEIKSNEWYLDKDNNSIKQNKSEHLLSYSQNCFKVIATTDPELNLPKPTEGFIKKYVEKYNKRENL